METLQIGTLHPASALDLTRAEPPAIAAPAARSLRQAHPRPPAAAARGPERLPLALAGEPGARGARAASAPDRLASEQHRLTDQLLPTLAVERRASRPTTWHGPLGQLRNLLFGEFMFADTFFVLYLEKQLHELSADDPGRKKMLADYHALQERIEGVSKQMKNAGQESGFFEQALGNAFAFAAGGGIEALAEKVIDVGKDIAETMAKFETYETVITNALGDKDKAQKTMKASWR